MKPIIWFFYMMNETFNGTYFQKKRSQFGLSTQFLKCRGVGTGEASESRASPEIRAFTIEKF